MNKTTNKINNYINHIFIVLDRSVSMRSLASEVVKVVDSQIEHLAERSKALDQETRVTIYLFSDDIENICYDKDVLRLPSLAGFYNVQGNTALIDATIKSIEDLKKTPELYGDHSTLGFVLTDGEENSSRNTAGHLKSIIDDLPGNWTLAVLVPNQNAVFEAKKFGFPVQNIQVWSTTTAGVKEVGRVIREATDSYMTNRAKGIRGTKTLFKLDTSNLDSQTVKSNLEELKPDQYYLFSVHQKAPIKDFVEAWTKEYRIGSAYYQLTKPEKIQQYKQIIIQDKSSAKVYSGPNARAMLNLPEYEITVNPTDHNKYDLFAQSTSVNRNLVPGTKLIVLK